MSKQDSGLWKRGVVLLILVGAISAAALFFVLRLPSVNPSAEKPMCNDIHKLTLATSFAPFPASVDWGLLYHMSKTEPSPKGWEIRYNAALALARKGNPDLPLDIMREMLDERRQKLNFTVCSRYLRQTEDEALARRTVYNALQAFMKWYKQPQTPKKFDAENAELEKKYNAELEQTYDAVAQLSQSSNQTIRTEAQKALKLIGRK